MSAAIAHWCYVNLKELPPMFVHTIGVAHSNIGQVGSVKDIDHPAIVSGAD